MDGDLWLTIGHKGRSQMLIFEAAPIARRDDDDAILVDPDEAIECRSAGAAIETARQITAPASYRIIRLLQIRRPGDRPL
jgi:hypothetical protein